MHRAPTTLLSFVLAATLTTALAAQSRPNVLLIVADDLTAEALGCYGNPQCSTPHIDALARRGLVFERAYCQFPVCGPARAGLMSGRHPQSVGVDGNGGAEKLAEGLGGQPTLPELFRQHGWYTARVSKIFHMRVPGDITAGVDGPDHLASWVERFNCKAPEWMTVGASEMLSNEKLRRDPDAHYNLGFGTAFYVVKGESDGVEQADAQAASKAVELLGGMDGKPFFLAVGFVRPHVPLVAPARMFAPYPPESIELAAAVDDDRADIPKAGLSLTSERHGLTDPDRQRKVRAAYYAAVSYMDENVGRVLAALEAHGLRDDTLVVFTSDHGYHLGEHGFWQKMSLHEESARIPLILAGPRVDPGMTARLAQQIDIYPTLAEYAGLAVPATVEGRSLAPLLQDHTVKIHDAVTCSRGTGRLLRTEQWALLAWNDGSAELYDMDRDPQQFTNLADDAEHAPIRKALEEQLAALGR